MIASRTLNALMGILLHKNSNLALNMSSRRLSIQSGRCSVLTVRWKDPGLMESHMAFVYSKDQSTGGSEHSRMDNYMEDHAGFRILLVDGDTHTNPCAMDNQLVSGDCIAVTRTHAL